MVVVLEVKVSMAVVAVAVIIVAMVGRSMTELLPCLNSQSHWDNQTEKRMIPGSIGHRMAEGQTEENFFLFTGFHLAHWAGDEKEDGGEDAGLQAQREDGSRLVVKD